MEWGCLHVLLRATAARWLPRANLNRTLTVTHCCMHLSLLYTHVQHIDHAAVLYTALFIPCDSTSALVACDNTTHCGTQPHPTQLSPHYFRPPPYHCIATSTPIPDAHHVPLHTPCATSITTLPLPTSTYTCRTTPNLLHRSLAPCHTLLPRQRLIPCTLHSFHLALSLAPMALATV